MIRKNSKFKKIFDSIMDFCIYCSVFLSLSELGFQEKIVSIIAFGFVLWVMFIFDFILNFFTEYQNKQKQQVQNLNMIAKRYLKTWLFFDFLSILPFNLGGFSDLENFFILSRVFKMRRFVKKIKIHQLAESIADFCYAEESTKKKAFRINFFFYLEFHARVF